MPSSKVHRRFGGRLWHWHWTALDGTGLVMALAPHWHGHTTTLPVTLALSNPSFSFRRIRAQLKRATRRGMRGLRAAGQWAGGVPSIQQPDWFPGALLLSSHRSLALLSLPHPLPLPRPLLLVPSRSARWGGIIAWSRWPTQASSHQSGKVGQGGPACRALAAGVSVLR